MTKHVLGAVATLIGAIIGAGVLGIPYVIAKSGFLIGAVHIILLGLAALLINLYVGEIALRTKGKHQLTKYAEIYLGKYGKALMLFAMLIGLYGALTAYLIGEGASIGQLFGINPVFAMIIFFAIMAFFIFRGLNIIEGAEIYLNIFRLVFIAILLFIAFYSFDFSNVSYTETSGFFVPYGAVFFALMGAAAIPELKEELRNNRKLLKKALIIGSIIPIVVYLVLAFAIIGVTGKSTTEIATQGLSSLGWPALIVGDLFAIISMATAFLVLGLALKWVFEYDYKINKHIAFLLTMAVPFAIVFFISPGFSKVLGITGAVAGGLEGILIVLIHSKAANHGNPEYVVKNRLILNILLISLFVIGIIYTILL
ncbi:MAG: aromatic amino acid transport family protein [Nanoarchaeota archaeon]